MANWSEFVIHVTGPLTDLQSLDAEIRSVIVFDDYHQPVADLSRAPEIWGKFHGRAWFEIEPNESLAEKGQLEEEPALKDSAELTIQGASKWVPPLEFLEKASLRYPELVFDLKSTTEHELAEHWSVKAGKSTFLAGWLCDPKEDLETDLTWEEFLLVINGQLSDEDRKRLRQRAKPIQYPQVEARAPVSNGADEVIVSPCIIRGRTE